MGGGGVFVYLLICSFVCLIFARLDEALHTLRICLNDVSLVFLADSVMKGSMHTTGCCVSCL